jgi:gliding motility-associated-like protein
MALERRFLLFFVFWFAGQSPAFSYIFIKNQGQWPSEVLYRTSIPSGQLWVTQKGLVYQLYEEENSPHYSSSRQGRKSFSSQNISLDFKNNCRFSKKEANAKQTFNFFIGQNQTAWKTNVPAFEEIYLENVFDGIDFRMYSTDQSLKYEYIVKPGADASQIKFKYDGANETFLKKNELVLKTNFGLIKEFQPFTYQNLDQQKKPIKSAFKISDDYISFQIAEYNHNQELIIDPELVFSTYSGSLSDNWSHTATFDSKGNTYAAGTVFGVNFPVSINAYQPKSGGTTTQNDVGYRTDVVIVKYSEDGSKILYSTFLGGNESEVPHSLIVNSKDELVIFGTTSSETFPTTNTSFDHTFNGGTFLNGPPVTSNIAFFSGTDIFVTVLSENGDRLLGSTFVGGSENDGIHDFRALEIQNYGDEFRGEVYVDALDNIYVASISTSANFPVQAAIQTKKSAYDAVVFKLNKYCNQLLFSTFIGGNNYDAAYGIRVDKSNAIYVCGVTLSKDFPISNQAFRKTMGGDTEGFILKIENQKLVSSTYIGTSKGDLTHLIDLDLEGNVYVLGSTLGEYSVSNGVYQNAKSGQFVQVLSNNLSSSKFSSIFGTGRGFGTVDLVPTAFMVNDCGNIYVAGWGGRVNSENGYNKNSTTKGLPITENAFKKTTSGSNYYFAIFEKGFKSLLYGTFFGSNPPANADEERGDHLDGGTCRFDKNGTIYHSACVCKAFGFVEFPLKNAVESNHRNGNCNMAAFKFNLDALSAKFDLKDGAKINPTEICAPTKIDFDNNTIGGETFEWYVNNAKVSTGENINYTFTDAGQYKIKLVAYNKVTCKAVDSTFRTLNVKAFQYKTSNDTTVCPGASVLMKASGGKSYKWSPSLYFENSASPEVTTKVQNSQVFTVEISNEECTIKKDIKVNVENTKTDFGATSNTTICKGNSLSLNASGLADKFVWSGDGISDSTKASVNIIPNKTGNYTVKAFYSDGCTPIKTIKVTVDESVKLAFDFEYKFACHKPSEVVFNNKSTGAQSYVWRIGENPETNDISTFGIRSNSNTQLTLKGLSAAGCAFETSKNLDLKFYDGIIPNVITPNNDKKNDTFVVGYPSSALQIFNAWGKKIFEDFNYQNDWGNKINSGTYYYLLTIPDGQVCKGWLEVLN